MGLFSKLFGSSSDIEKQLEELYIPIFQKTMGMSLDQAKKFFQDMFQLVKEESLKEGTENLPQNYGDLLLEAESIDEKTKEMLAKKRREGVRDEDIR
jgi:polyhydroxyalkanoate synthesis regulator phasin